MKLLLITASFFFLTTKSTCKNKNTPAVYDNCFKGRLEIKANCMNYTVSILEGQMDTSLYNASWTNESTGKSYKDVFALGSRCSFPNTINEGDEFYFTLDSTSDQGCAVCMMYYPVPPKKLEIKVIPGPCANN